MCCESSQPSLEARVARTFLSAYRLSYGPRDSFPAPVGFGDFVVVPADNRHGWFRA
jgi:hypothetical protein